MNAAVYVDLDTWEEMKRTVVLRPLLLEYSLTQTADRDGSTVVVKVSSDGAATTTITETSPGASR